VGEVWDNRSNYLRFNYGNRMNDIQVFNNPQFGAVRTAGTADNPMFCLADVCQAIGIANARNVKGRLEEDDVHLVDTIDNLGRTQQVTFVTESGLYDVIIRSDSEQAKPFRKWVTSEVLPSIRKHGMYATGETIESILNNPENAIVILQAMQKERKERIAAQQQVEKLEAQAIEDKPKIIYADAVKGSTSSCLIGELAKMIAQNGYPIGEKRLFQWLRDNHYLCSYGERFNQPYQQYIEQGLFTMKQNVFSVDGEMRTRNTTKVTGKGQIYFINKFIGEPQASQ
jgi:anti-repressor protein